MKLKLKVTQEHIDRAVEAQRTNPEIAYICPVAQCIKENVCPDVVVSFTLVSLIDEGDICPFGRLGSNAGYFTTAQPNDWSTLEPRTITIEEV